MHICRRRVARVPTGRSHAATLAANKGACLCHHHQLDNLLGRTLGAAGDPPCWTST